MVLTGGREADNKVDGEENHEKQEDNVSIEKDQVEQKENEEETSLPIKAPKPILTGEPKAAYPQALSTPLSSKNDRHREDMLETFN